MSGYTPLFSSLTTGTLCGKWPDIGLWPIVLSLCDKHGVVDVTPQYISGVTGLAVDEVVACMKRFCEPDRFSRSSAESGARLVLVDEHRDWGWRIVNQGIYREKARLAAKNAREVDTGRNAERMGHRKTPETAADRRIPPLTDPSYANANANADKNAPTEKTPTERKSAPQRASRRVPGDFQPDLDYARAQCPDIDAEREAQKFRDWEFKHARKDWPAAWRTWIGNCLENGKYARAPKSGMTFAGKPVEWQ